MQRISQFGMEAPRPMWLRVLALLCILVVAVMSTAQVSHTHAEFSALKQQNSHSPAPDDHCPLCVAMHSALAAPQQFAPEPTLSIQRLDSVAAEAERLFRWRFEMASRPPPAQANA
ncbi:hypothetical protein [Edaphobacter flagellatus]|uniref:hypothetical protein n=1 Tax=Edaphobacter flagellatus TaxID=1933044 RepID=UPI0021B17253|nr:hypothetical protein [Edaphobacter flagellatus]